jgi:hypothetical protein
VVKGLRPLALGGLWLLIFLACLEVGLRLAPQAIPLSVLSRFDPALRSRIAARRNLARAADTVLLPRSDGGPPDRMWFFKPGTRVTSHDREEGVVEQVTMDQNGLCNSPADAYQTARFDVIALGDSFTWCTAVSPDEAWPARLQAITGLSTYNAGMSGRGLYEYVQILERFGLPKHPDVVVMAVYEGNDFRDAHRFHRARVGSPEQGETRVCAFAWQPLCRLHAALDGSFLRRHSLAYNLLSGSVHVASYAARKSEIDFRYEVGFPDGEILEFNSDNGDRDEVQYARWLAEGQLGTDLFDEALESFVALAREERFVPLVVYIPSAYTAFEHMSQFDDPAIEEPLRAYSRTLREYFRRRGAELGYRYVDTTPMMQRVSQRLPSSRRLYFRSNVHLTQRGHELVARLVAEDLGRLGAWPMVNPLPRAQ